jgi:alpha-tubulin suppressor-like RCC1 family protein
VKCWGLNNRGQLGDGTTVNSPVPVDVAGLGSGVRAISAGTSYTCALTSAGGVVCWGANQNGQLGDGSTTDRSTPVAVAGLAGVSMIDTSTGSTSSSVGSHTCAASQDGTVACWGTNRSGQLGDGTTTSRPTPAPVVGLPAGMQAVATGSHHSCALGGTGAVWCWGEDNLGQLGVGRATLAPRTVPVEVTSLAVAGAELTAGSFHTCALDRRGGLACWGANVAGQVGDGATEFFRLTPIEVSGSFHRPECVTLIPAPHTTFTLTNGYALGSRATFAANSGYMLTGPADLRCQPAGTWTGPEPPAVGTGRVTVTPSTALVDRQVVTVTLTGWPALGTVPWCQGIQHTPADIGDCGNNRLMFSTADATGTIVTTFSVDRVMSVPTLGRTVDCAVEPICVIAATDIQDIVGSVRYAPLSFAPPP